VKRVLVILALVIMVAGAVYAQKPVRNINKQRHFNLAKAQRASANAYKFLIDAQKANEWDLGGHAQKAKELLEQANNEMKQAAEAANKK